MNTKAILPLFLLVLTACSNNGTSIPQIKFSGMKGNISMIKESCYDATEKFGEIVPDELNGVNIWEFDNDGNQTKFGCYDEDGDYIYKVETTYENGNIVSETSYAKIGNKKTENKVIERKKNYIKWLFDIGTENENSVEHIYDGLYYKGVDKDGKLVEECFFDKKGRLIERKSYSNGELSYRGLMEYDKDNNLTKLTQYYSTGEASTVTYYTYPEFDKKGNWITLYLFEDGEIQGIFKREITYR